jgi:hypothetical protein
VHPSRLRSQLRVRDEGFEQVRRAQRLRVWNHVSSASHLRVAMRQQAADTAALMPQNRKHSGGSELPRAARAAAAAARYTRWRASRSTRSAPWQR